GLKQILRGLTECVDAGLIQRIGKAHAFEGAAQNVAGGGSESRAGLVVVQELVLDRRRQVDLVVRRNSGLARLVEVILAAVHGEPQGERPVKHVGFGKAEEQDPGKTAYAGLNGKRFAQAQEVVGLVIQSDERAFQTAHASSKPDAVLAFLLDLDRQIHGGVLLVNLALRVLFG